MRRSFLWACAVGVAVATFLTWRSGVGESPAPVPAPAVPSSRLPVLGTVGDLPPAEERLVVEADARGRVFEDGRAVSAGEFRDLLQARADASREEEGPRASRLHVVLRVDRDLPWLGTRWLMQACADPRVRAYRLFFAALPEAGGEEGAMAAYLPGPDCLDVHGRVLVGVPVAIAASGDSGVLPRRDLYRELRWVVERSEGREEDGVQASLDAAPEVPTGRLLEAADLCLRAGFRSLVFRGGPRQGVDESLEAAVAALPAGGGGLSFRIRRAPVECAPDRVEALDPVARVARGYAGQASSPPVAWGDDPEESPTDLPDGPQVDIGHSGPPEGSQFRGRRGGLSVPSTEEAVHAALDWLSRHQSRGGFWDCDGFEAECKERRCGGAGAVPYDAGVSGLATLAVLAAGETHKSPRFGPVVRNALKFLKGCQDAEGCFGPRVEGGWSRDCIENRVHTEPNKFTYGHAIAALAMAEAYGMTQSPLFKASAQNGVNFIHQCQNPYLAWRYGLRPQDNDTSVTGWMVLALRVAKEAGLDVDPAAFEGALDWLDRVTIAETGRTGYTKKDDGPRRYRDLPDRFPAERSESLTAEAVLARILCGTKADDVYVLRGADLCAKSPPRWDEAAGTIDFCYWHFGSLAMFQIGGERWTAWSGAAEAALLGSQRRDAGDDRRGSWDPADPWGPDGGRVYATALNALTLQTARRYAKFGPAR